MLDPDKTPAQEMEIPAIWAGVINGLLQGRDQSIILRVSDLVEQAFDQSPYL